MQKLDAKNLNGIEELSEITLGNCHVAYCKCTPQIILFNYISSVKRSKKYKNPLMQAYLDEYLNGLQIGIQKFVHREFSHLGSAII